MFPLCVQSTVFVWATSEMIQIAFGLIWKCVTADVNVYIITDVII